MLLTRARALVRRHGWIVPLALLAGTGPLLPDAVGSLLGRGPGTALVMERGAVVVREHGSADRVPRSSTSPRGCTGWQAVP